MSEQFFYCCPPHNPCSQACCEPIISYGKTFTLLREGILPKTGRKKHDNELHSNPFTERRNKSRERGQGDADLQSVQSDQNTDKFPAITVTDYDSNFPHWLQGKLIHENVRMVPCKQYQEYKGPILVIRTKDSEIKLSAKEYIILNTQKVDEKENQVMPTRTTNYERVRQLYAIPTAFTRQELEPFSITTNCKQTKWIIVQNRGSTAVTFLWLRRPPHEMIRGAILRQAANSSSMQFSCNEENKSGVGVEGTEPRFWKNSDSQFHFGESKHVLLPGQKVKMPIIFRSRKEGLFYENLYLVTYPRLSDDNDAVYRLRITGICMDNFPECCSDSGLETGADPSSDSKQKRNCKVTLEHVTKELNGRIGRYEAAELLNRMLRSFVCKSGEQSHECSIGTPTAESVFYLHNEDMHYRYNVAENTLSKARQLLQGLVSRKAVLNNPNFCPLSIKSLYYALVENFPESEKHQNEFEKPETESLLGKFYDSSSLLFKPRHFFYPGESTKVYTNCYALVSAMMNDLYDKAEEAREQVSTGMYSQLLWNQVRRELIKQKIEQVQNSSVYAHAGEYGEDEQDPEEDHTHVVRSNTKEQVPALPVKQQGGASSDANEEENELPHDENSSDLKTEETIGETSRTGSVAPLKQDYRPTIELSEEDIREKFEELQRIRIIERTQLVVRWNLRFWLLEIARTVERMRNSFEDYRRCNSFEKHVVGCSLDN